MCLGILCTLKSKSKLASSSQNTRSINYMGWILLKLRSKPTTVHVLATLKPGTTDHAFVWLLVTNVVQRQNYDYNIKRVWTPIHGIVQGHGCDTQLCPLFHNAQDISIQTLCIINALQRNQMPGRGYIYIMSEKSMDLQDEVSRRQQPPENFNDRFVHVCRTFGHFVRLGTPHRCSHTLWNHDTNLTIELAKMASQCIQLNIPYNDANFTTHRADEYNAISSWI